MTTTPSIIVAHASVGSGHRLAAEAIARELTSLAGDRIDVQVIDALDECPDAALRLADGPWTAAPLGRMALGALGALTSLRCREFASRLESARPAAVISTHPLVTVVAARLAARGDLLGPVIVAPTEFGVRGMTPAKGVALYCTAGDGAAEALIRRGIPRDSVIATGIPVRPQFTVEYDVPASRRHFDLPVEGRIVLAVAGSTDPGPYAQFKESLAVLLPALASLPDTTLAIVTGKDNAFAAELKSRVKGFGTTNVRVFDQVEHMAPLIACADLVLARPAGLVCAECVDTGTPLVLVGPATGPEQTNARALVEAGAALFAEDPRTLAEHTKKAVSSPRRLARMREAAHLLARPFAADDIARHALELAGITPGEAHA